MRLCSFAWILIVLGGCAPSVRARSNVVTTGAVLAASTTATAPAAGPLSARQEAGRLIDGRSVLDAEALEERDAAAVFRTLHPDLVTCLGQSRAPRRGGHAYVTAEVLVGPDGEVRGVSTTGAAQIGRRAMACVERRIARATFRAPRHGGTRRVSVPFAFDVDGR